MEDGGSPKKSDTADLIINIIDVNEPPMFTGDCSSGCRLNIDEGDGIGRQVKQLSATDPEKSACGLKFSITSSDKSYFSIGQTSGMITTKSPIDRETKETYELHVVVRDCANPPLSDSVTVFVTANDINDNTPLFPVAKYTANVNENQGAGTRVIRTQATGKFRLFMINSFFVYVYFYAMLKSNILCHCRYQFEFHALNFPIRFG